MIARGGELSERLRAALRLSHLRAFPDATPEDEAAFSLFAVELTSHYAVLASAFMFLITLAWWPIDYLVRPDARYLEVFAYLRPSALVIMGITFAVFAGSSRARRHALVVGPIAYTSFLALIGYSLGRLGGPDLSWFANAIIGIVPLAAVPLRLRRRIVTTALVGLSLPAAFFLPFPENWRAPTAQGQISFVVFAMMLSVLLGDVLQRALQRSFFQQRSLARARSELAALSASLADRVAEQTHELRRLADHLDRAREAERRRVSRDLHDQLGQELTAMRYTLARLTDRLTKEPEAAQALVADLEALLDGAAGTVRSFVSELRPRVLDDLGLEAAAEWLCERVRASSEIACSLTAEPGVDEGVEPEVAAVLFRVLQEATTNTRKHADARAVFVSLRAEDGEVTVEVRDDGKGFEPSARTDGFGLLGLRERVAGCGGRLVVERLPERGIRVAATVPRRRAPAERGLS